MSVPSVIPFSFENHPVRVLIINGEPWFVAKTYVQYCTSLIQVRINCIR